MPVILRNNTNSIEIDISANLKYTITKGDFDVILEDTGNNAAMVFIVMRSHAITDRSIKLDWRDISDPVVASAEALRDLLLTWNIPAVQAGAATEATMQSILTQLRVKVDIKSYYFENAQTEGLNIKLSAGNLHSIVFLNITNNAVITLVDGTTGSTPVLLAHTAGATKTEAYSLDLKGIPFYFGLRLIVAAANAALLIIYE